MNCHKGSKAPRITKRT